MREEKTSKIVTLPDTFAPHNNYDDGRRTFIYLVPTNTVYIAPNNAYHRDIWDWLAKNKPQEYEQLWANKFSDAFKEGSVALGLFDRNYEDHSLEARTYWAEGNDDLPHSIMDELSHYFGEKVYVRPWEYPVDWTQIHDMPEPYDDEPTQQWPTDSLDQITTRAKKLMDRIKHDKMAESLPDDSVTASSENPNLVLQGPIAIGESYRGWDGRIDQKWGDHEIIYNVIDQDPEYHEEYDEYPIVGSIVYGIVEYRPPEQPEYNPKREDDPVLHVEELYVDPDYRRTNAFYMLVEPVIAAGVPLHADFENARLQNLFMKLKDRGTIKVHPSFEPNPALKQNPLMSDAKVSQQIEEKPAFVYDPETDQIFFGLFHRKIIRDNGLNAKVQDVSDPDAFGMADFKSEQLVYGIYNVMWEDEPMIYSDYGKSNATPQQQKRALELANQFYMGKTAAMREVKWIADQLGGTVENGGVDEVNGKPLPPYLVMPDGTRVQIGVTLKKNWQDGRPAMVLHWIEADPRRAGAGTKVMEALKQMCDQKGIDLQVYMAAGHAEPFYQKFDWLDNSSPTFPIYRQALTGYEQQREAGTQPVEVMVSSGYYNDYLYNLNDGYRSRVAWCYQDGTLYIGDFHRDIMREMRFEGLNPTKDALYGWIDPHNDGQPWKIVTDGGVQDESLTPQVEAFFQQYPPDAVMNYARTGELTKASAWKKLAMDIEWVEGDGEDFNENRLPWVYDVDANKLWVSDWGAMHRPILKALKHSEEHATNIRDDTLIGGYTTINGRWQPAIGSDYDFLSDEVCKELDAFSAQAAQDQQAWIDEADPDRPQYDMFGVPITSAVDLAMPSTTDPDYNDFFAFIYDPDKDVLFGQWGGLHTKLRPLFSRNFGEPSPDTVYGWMKNGNVSQHGLGVPSPELQARVLALAETRRIAGIQYVETDETGHGGMNADDTYTCIYVPDEDTLYVNETPGSSHRNLLKYVKHDLHNKWGLDWLVKSESFGFGWIYWDGTYVVADWTAPIPDDLMEEAAQKMKTRQAKTAGIIVAPSGHDPGTRFFNSEGQFAFLYDNGELYVTRGHHPDILMSMSPDKRKQVRQDFKNGLCAWGWYARSAIEFWSGNMDSLFGDTPITDQARAYVMQNLDEIQMALTDDVVPIYHDGDEFNNAVEQYHGKTATTIIEDSKMDWEWMNDYGIYNLIWVYDPTQDELVVGTGYHAALIKRNLRPDEFEPDDRSYGDLIAGAYNPNDPRHDEEFYPKERFEIRPEIKSMLDQYAADKGLKNKTAKWTRVATVLPNDPWNDPAWLREMQGDDYGYGDHTDIENPYIPFLMLEDGRHWIGWDAHSHAYDWMMEDAEQELGVDFYDMKDSQGSVNFAGNEYQVHWPNHGLHRELEPQIVKEIVDQVEEERRAIYNSSNKTASEYKWLSPGQAEDRAVKRYVITKNGETIFMDVGMGTHRRLLKDHGLKARDLADAGYIMPDGFMYSFMETPEAWAPYLEDHPTYRPDPLDAILNPNKTAATRFEGDPEIAKQYGAQWIYDPVDDRFVAKMTPHRYLKEQAFALDRRRDEFVYGWYNRRPGHWTEWDEQPDDVERTPVAIVSDYMPQNKDPNAMQRAWEAAHEFIGETAPPLPQNTSKTAYQEWQAGWIYDPIDDKDHSLDSAAFERIKQDYPDANDWDDRTAALIEMSDPEHVAAHQTALIYDPTADNLYSLPGGYHAEIIRRNPELLAKRRDLGWFELNEHGLLLTHWAGDEKWEDDVMRLLNSSNKTGKLAESMAFGWYNGQLYAQPAGSIMHKDLGLPMRDAEFGVVHPSGEIEMYDSGREEEMEEARQAAQEYAHGRREVMPLFNSSYRENSTQTPSKVGANALPLLRTGVHSDSSLTWCGLAGSAYEGAWMQGVSTSDLPSQEMIDHVTSTLRDHSQALAPLLNSYRDRPHQTCPPRVPPGNSGTPISKSHNFSSFSGITSRNSPFRIEQVENLLRNGEHVAFAYQNGQLIWGIDENNFTVTHPGMIRKGLVDRSIPAAWGWVEGVEGFQAPKAYIVSYEEHVDESLVPAAVKAVHDELGISVEDQHGITLSSLNSPVSRDSLTHRLADNEPYTVVYVPVSNNSYNYLHGDSIHTGWVDLESHIIYIGTQGYHHRDVRNSMRQNLGVQITNEGWSPTDVERWTWVEWNPSKNVVRGPYPVSEQSGIQQALENWNPPEQHYAAFEGTGMDTGSISVPTVMGDFQTEWVNTGYDDHHALLFFPESHRAYICFEGHHRDIMKGYGLRAGMILKKEPWFAYEIDHNGFVEFDWGSGAVPDDNLDEAAQQIFNGARDDLLNGQLGHMEAKSLSANEPQNDADTPLIQNVVKVPSPEEYQGDIGYSDEPFILDVDTGTLYLSDGPSFHRVLKKSCPGGVYPNNAIYGELTNDNPWQGHQNERVVYLFRQGATAKNNELYNKAAKTFADYFGMQVVDDDFNRVASYNESDITVVPPDLSVTEGHDAVVYDVQNDHLYICPDGHHRAIFRAFPYLKNVLWHCGLYETNRSSEPPDLLYVDTSGQNPASGENIASAQELYSEWYESEVMRTTKTATTVQHVPENGPLLDSSRTPIVYDSHDDVVYIGDRGGTHPSLLSEAAGVVMHMSEVPLKRKDIYERFAAGLYTPKDGGAPWTTAQPGYCEWFYGPKPSPEVDRAIENYVENEYVNPRAAPQQLEDWRQNRMAKRYIAGYWIDGVVRLSGQFGNNPVDHPQAESLRQVMQTWIDNVGNGMNPDEATKIAVIAPAKAQWIGEPTRNAIFVWHIPSNTIYFASMFQTYHRTIMRELEPEVAIKNSLDLFLLGEVDNLTTPNGNLIEVGDRQGNPYPNPEVAAAVEKAYRESGGDSLPAGHPGLTSAVHFMNDGLPDQENSNQKAFIYLNGDLYVSNGWLTHPMMLRQLGLKGKDLRAENTAAGWINEQQEFIKIHSWEEEHLNDNPALNQQVLDAVQQVFPNVRYVSPTQYHQGSYYHFIEEHDAESRWGGLPFVITHEGQVIVSDDPEEHHRRMMQNIGGSSHDIATAGVIYPDGTFTILWDTVTGDIDEIQDLLTQEVPDSVWSGEGHGLDTYSATRPGIGNWDGSWFYLPDTDELFATPPDDKGQDHRSLVINSPLLRQRLREEPFVAGWYTYPQTLQNADPHYEREQGIRVIPWGSDWLGNQTGYTKTIDPEGHDDESVVPRVVELSKEKFPHYHFTG